MAQPTMRQRSRGGPGRAQWLALGGVALVALVLTFALGVLVGRQLARHPEPAQAAAEPTRRPASAPAPRRSGLAEPVPERPAVQEKLTFYQTLTAPLGPGPGSPRADVAKPRPVSDRPPTPAAPGDRLTAPASSPRAAPPDKSSAPAAGAPASPRPAEKRTADWTVQVGAFRDRGQAESVRKPLATAGLDVYVTETAEAGQLRYKVRVGGFKTREEAARMAERMRQERSLTAFVTAR